MRKLQFAVLGVAAVVAAVLGFLLFLRGQDNTNSPISLSDGFHLASSKGGEVDSRDLAGKPYAVFFGYTHCPEVCPATLYEMSSALTKFGDAAKEFRVFFITVDPERDTVEKMTDYIANFDPRMEALVPTLEQLPKLASVFRVYYAKVPTSDGGYVMDHTATVFLINADGRLGGTISFGEAAEMREAKLKKLLGL